MNYDSFREGDENLFKEPEKPVKQEEAGVTPQRVQRQRRGNFLGMTAVQRFIIAVMLLVMTCLLGILCLLVTQRMVPTL
jgi:hypothetical protein